MAHSRLFHRKTQNLGGFKRRPPLGCRFLRHHISHNHSNFSLFSYLLGGYSIEWLSPTLREVRANATLDGERHHPL